MAPNLPPCKGISSQAVLKPGHATKAVATQQPDKSFHLIILAMWSLCSCKGSQAFNDRSYERKDVTLP